MSDEFPFPSRMEVQCSGCSLVWSQLLWILPIMFYDIILQKTTDRTVYDVKTEEDVIKLHDALSSNFSRDRVEVYAACLWLSVPLCLIAIYGMRKLLLSMYNGTKAELWIYMLEKSYLFYVLVMNILVPAIALVAVSFEWSIHEYTEDTADYVPTGYYIQLYAVTLHEELADAMSIADGTFLCLAVLIPQYQFYLPSRKFRTLGKVSRAKRCFHYFFLVMGVVTAISYLVCLFRFAESGFFSMRGGASWAPLLGIVLKILLGARMFVMGCSPRYNELNRVFGQLPEDDREMIAGSGQTGYAMETLDKGTKKTDEQKNDDVDL